MDVSDIRAAGQDFRVGEDLYGVSITQLQHRLAVLQAEIDRIHRAVDEKSAELTTAESFFKKS